MENKLLPCYKKILVTGGLGFIGGALISNLLENTQANIYNIDKLGYASDPKRIVDKISIQKGIKIDVEFIKEANHMFSNHDEELMEAIRKYLNNALDSSEYREI